MSGVLAIHQSASRQAPARDRMSPSCSFKIGFRLWSPDS